MKIDLSKINPNEFRIVHGLIAGEDAVLITPKDIGCKWTKNNLHLRSSMWVTKTGEPCSLGLKKFFNWLEKPELDYTPFSTTANGGIRVLEKIDGSTLLVSKFRGELIIRTRGVISAAIHENGCEVEVIKQKYPKAFEFAEETSNHTRVFEWVSDAQKIVLSYPDCPDIYLIGKIYHEDYRYETQENLDILAKELGVKRPRYYNFDDIKEMIEAVEAFKGVEGVCVYCNNQQSIRKLKGLDYLAKHSARSRLSLETIIDLFVELDCPNFTAFKEKIISSFDFEFFTVALPFVSKVCEAHREVEEIIEGMRRFINKHNTLSRKDFAINVISSYGKTNRASFLFTLKDKGSLDRENIKKLTWQILKND